MTVRNLLRGLLIAAYVGLACLWEDRDVLRNQLLEHLRARCLRLWTRYCGRLRRLPAGSVRSRRGT